MWSFTNQPERGTEEWKFGLGSVLPSGGAAVGLRLVPSRRKGPAPVVAEEPQGEPTIIEPQVNRREVKTPKIKAKDFEIGGYFGALSIQDFGDQPVYGVRAAYHRFRRTFSGRLLARLESGDDQPGGRLPQNITVVATLGDAHVLRTLDVATTYYLARSFLRAGTCFSQFALYVTVVHGRREIYATRTRYRHLNFGLASAFSLRIGLLCTWM